MRSRDGTPLGLNNITYNPDALRALRHYVRPCVLRMYQQRLGVRAFPPPPPQNAWEANLLSCLASDRQGYLPDRIRICWFMIRKFFEVLHVTWVLLNNSQSVGYCPVFLCTCSIEQAGGIFVYCPAILLDAEYNLLCMRSFSSFLSVTQSASLSGGISLSLARTETYLSKFYRWTLLLDLLLRVAHMLLLFLTRR